MAQVASFAPEWSEGANDVTRDTNYVPNKSHLIIIINTQGQIVPIHLIRKNCLTEMYHETMVWKCPSVYINKGCENERNVYI